MKIKFHVLFFILPGAVSLIFLFLSIKNDYTTHTPYSAAGSPDDGLTWFRQRAFPYGKIDNEAYRKAIAWRQKQEREKNTTSGDWESVGPDNIGGRITDIELIPSSDGAYFTGTASGGVFYNGSEPITDGMPVHAIGDIALQDPGGQTIWVGTGEPNGGGGSLSYDGSGIYVVHNFGESWEHKGLENTGSISKILIDPDNLTLYAAATGPLFVKNNHRGVYRSTDMGDTWEQVLFVSDSTSVIDMAMNPVNPQRIYAVTWERVRTVNRRHYGGETSGIYRSDDGGDTWTELTNGLPSDPDEKGRISIDISRSNPDILYASYAKKNGYLQGIYKSTDGGDTWIALDVSNITDVSYHWWFGGVFVHPEDPAVVYYAGLYLAKSTDGGNTWTEDTSIHVDQHTVAFREGYPGHVWVGNDGGVYKSTSYGIVWEHVENMPVTQIYRIMADETNEAIFAGTQDNNTLRTLDGTSGNWVSILGGDGFQPLVEHGTNTVYAEFQYGNLFRSYNYGGTFTYIAGNGISANDRHYWDTPVTMDPQNPAILYYGTQKVYRTENRGNSWVPISGDLSNGPYAGGNLTYGTVTTIDASPLDSQIIAAGTDDGNVWITTDGGTAWTKVSDGLPQRWVTKVYFGKDNGHLYVSFSGYRYGENTGHIFESDDMGTTWTDISGNLPDIPVNDIDGDMWGCLFAATDVGVFHREAGSTGWNVAGSGNLPFVPVLDLYFKNSTNTLYAGTYGRSAYTLDHSVFHIGTDDTAFPGRVNVYPNPFGDTLYIEMENTADTRATLYDISGKAVLQTDSPERLDTRSLAPGMYVLEIRRANSTVKRRLVKR